MTTTTPADPVRLSTADLCARRIIARIKGAAEAARAEGRHPGLDELRRAGFEPEPTKDPAA